MVGLEDLLMPPCIYLPRRSLRTFIYLGPKWVKISGNNSAMSRKNKEKKVTFSFSLADDDESVALERGQDFRSGEMHDSGIVLEHVDFINTWDGLDSELADDHLEFLIISDGGFDHNLHLSSLGAFASHSSLVSELLC
jgi:hypothetical protein